MTRATDRVWVTTYEGRDLLGRIVENIDRVYVVESNAVARRVYINDHEEKFPGIVADVQEHGVSDGIVKAPVTRRPRQRTSGKLTAEDVTRIRESHARGTRVSVLATEFGVNTSTIYDVVNHETWRHV